MVDDLEVALLEPRLVLEAWERVGADLTQHGTDLQPDPRAHVSPRQAAEGDVLAGQSGGDRVTVGPEGVDDLVTSMRSTGVLGRPPCDTCNRVTRPSARAGS